MHFEVRYPDGTRHEITLEGSAAVVGRDPGCDLVLDDQRCSRRHAVIEAGPLGLAIRDTGSANGIFVNGKKVERAPLADGDLVQLGEMFLKVLPEEFPSTLMMEADETESALDLESTAPQDSPPLPVPRPSHGPPDRTGGARASGPLPRPVTATLLAAAWLLAGLLAAGVGVGLALLWPWPGRAPAWASAVTGTGLLVVGVVAAVGLWLRQPWARWLHILLGALGVLTCAFAPAGLAVVLYMLREETRLQLSGRSDLRLFTPAEAATLAEDRADGAFAGALAGGLLLGVLLAGGLLFVGVRALGAVPAPAITRDPEAARLRLERVATAQDAFHSLCNSGYADLEALLRPSSAITDYPAEGPPFVPAEYGQAEQAGYRFALTVEAALPAQPDCSTQRRFERYAYSADPIDGTGRHYVVGPDGVVRAASGRPATSDDAPASP